MDTEKLAQFRLSCLSNAIQVKISLYDDDMIKDKSILVIAKEYFDFVLGNK